MGKRQFKAESKRLLDLMVNSIYTHKEIFLREIISNASDAIDKLCYKSLTDDQVGMTREDFCIRIALDPEKRTVTVTDNGIGMTAEEMEQNLGVIARSGSFQFKKENDLSAEELDIIGQFGVGFYSAFMVAKKVTVISRAYGADTANMWVSTGVDGYTITEAERDGVGTTVIMELKDDTEEENYADFAEEATVVSLIKKYSDYVRWPIRMNVTRSRQVEKPDEKGEMKKTWEDYTEEQTVNSMIPIWQRPKNEVSDSDCMAFYKEKFFDFEDPVSVIRINAEGTVSYKAMLFIPGAAPADFYSREYQAGLQLYSAGVLIMDHCEDLLPPCYRFVRGVVDSQDLSLNISREMLQHNRQIKVMSNNIEKKITAELKRLMDKEPDKYDKFYRSFGAQLKFSFLNFYDKHDMLKPLLMFYSANVGKKVGIASYVSAMPESQKYIYYACGDSVENLATLPQAEPVREKGYDILYLTDEPDEFVVNMMGSYEEKEFKSVNAEDLGLETQEEKEQTEKKQEENKDVLDFVKTTMDGKLADVRISHKLKSHPVCLTTQGPITLEMEKYFASLPADKGGSVKAERVLELNADHKVFAALKEAMTADPERAADYAKLLYGQALLIAGMPVDDPAGFSDLICKYM
ncbi:MAG: molecular chaperone HtpG [Oscillospiraceae bacterium]|nr:molecular chaperone HtpG [Oscillospiraceae bacterium]